jgi:Polyketide cyclase / dehydrase and lipid transport
MEMHGRITEYEKNARMGFDVKGTGIQVRTAYSLTAVPHGTQLDVEADIHIGGRLSWLVDRFVRRRFARQFDSELARLRALAESRPRGST